MLVMLSQPTVGIRMLANILIPTVGHDSINITKCVCLLCMILSSVLILTVGHDSITKCVCVCVCVCVLDHALSRFDV